MLLKLFGKFLNLNENPWTVYPIESLNLSGKGQSKSLRWIFNGLLLFLSIWYSYSLLPSEVPSS